MGAEDPKGAVSRVGLPLRPGCTVLTKGAGACSGVEEAEGGGDVKSSKLPEVFDVPEDGGARDDDVDEAL